MEILKSAQWISEPNQLLNVLSIILIIFSCFCSGYWYYITRVVASLHSDNILLSNCDTSFALWAKILVNSSYYFINCQC